MLSPLSRPGAPGAIMALRTELPQHRPPRLKCTIPQSSVYSRPCRHRPRGALYPLDPSPQSLSSPRTSLLWAVPANRVTWCGTVPVGFSLSQGFLLRVVHTSGLSQDSVPLATSAPPDVETPLVCVCPPLGSVRLLLSRSSSPTQLVGAEGGHLYSGPKPEGKHTPGGPSVKAEATESLEEKRGSRARHPLPTPRPASTRLWAAGRLSSLRLPSSEEPPPPWINLISHR